MLASRYHGPMTCDASPVVRMYTQFVEDEISWMPAYVAGICVPTPRLQVVTLFSAFWSSLVSKMRAYWFELVVNHELS